MALTYTGLTRHLDVRGTIYKSDGTSINLDASQINNYKISESCASNGIPLGTTQSSTFVLAIKNVDHTLTADSLDGAVVAMEIAIETVDGYVWSDLGVWRVEDVSLPEQSNVATLYGADGLSGAEFAQVFEDDGAYPQTLAALLRRVCAVAEVALYSDELPNADAQVTQKPDWPEGITLRGVIGYVAACMGGFARINRSGQLQIVPFGRTRTHALDHATYKEFSPQNGEEFVFNCIQYSDGETTTRYAIDPAKEDTALNTIIVSGNPIMTPAMLQVLVTSLTGLNAIGAKLEWGGDPAVQCGDKIAVTDKSETTRVMLINSQELTVSGGFSASTVCNLPSVTKNEAESYKTRVSLLDVNGYINPKRIKDLGTTIANNRVVKEALQKIERAEKDLETLDGAVIELITTVDEVVGELSSKVDQTKYNSLAGTVSDHTTQIQQNANAISSKAEASVVDTLSGTVSGHTTQIQQNASAISSKAEASVVNTLSGTVQTLQSEVQQTPEKISAAVREIDIGGANLLVGTDKPITIGHIQNNVGVDGVYRSEPDASIDYPDRWMRVQDDNSAHTWIRHHFNADDHLPLIVGQEYTLSADVIRYKGQIRIGSSTRFSSWLGDDVLPEGEWKRISQTFVANDAGNWLMIDCQRVGATGSLFFDVRKVKLEYGNKDSGWRLADGEYKAGSALDMTKDHVNISTPELNIDIEGENALHMDKDGGTFANMTVTGYFSAPNIARTVPGQDIHVKSGNKFSKLSQVAAYLNNSFITGNVNIFLDEDAYGDYELAGIGGSGILGINTLGHKLYGSLTLSNISCEIDMYGVQIALPSASAKANALDVKVCSYLYMRDDPWSEGGPYKSSITGKGATVADSTAIYLHSGTNAYIINTSLFNAESLIAVRYACNAGFYGMSGKNCTNFITGNRSIITWTGSRPVGEKNLAACITSPADLSTLTTNDGSGVGPTPAPTTTTVTLTQTSARTNYGNTSWQAEQDIVYQGQYGDTAYRAVYWFDRTAISGKTIKSAVISLTRVSGSGTGGAVNVRLWGTPLADAGGNPRTGAEDYGVIGALNSGEKVTLTVPLAAAQALAAGTIKGLMLDPVDATITSRGYSANYTKIDADATLEVTYV